jgi:hypothetical protein
MNAKNKYLVFYDVNANDGSDVFGIVPLELSYEDNPIKTLIEKNVPIHKVYCLSGNSHFSDIEDFADDFNHEEISDQWWCITIESTDEDIMYWFDGSEDEEDDEYPSAEDEALWDENVNKLSKCQVIGQDHELYDWLNDLDDDDIQTLVEILAERNYTLKYNNLDECYVVS